MWATHFASCNPFIRCDRSCRLQTPLICTADTPNGVRSQHIFVCKQNVFWTEFSCNRNNRPYAIHIFRLIVMVIDICRFRLLHMINFDRAWCVPVSLCSPVHVAIQFLSKRIFCDEIFLAIFYWNDKYSVHQRAEKSQHRQSVMWN